MKLGNLLMAGVTAVVVMAAAPASAVPLLFDFSGPSGMAMFELDSNPTPDFSSSFLGSNQFGFHDVAGTFGGVRGIASTISFGDGVFASFNLAAPHLGFTQFVAPTLFTGPPTAPVFATGSYTLINPFVGNAMLSISPAAVAEPATWAMMIAGFAGLGTALRRRRSAVRRVQSASAA